MDCSMILDKASVVYFGHCFVSTVVRLLIGKSPTVHITDERVNRYLQLKKERRRLNLQF